MSVIDWRRTTTISPDPTERMEQLVGYQLCSWWKQSKTGSISLLLAFTNSEWPFMVDSVTAPGECQAFLGQSRSAEIPPQKAAGPLTPRKHDANKTLGGLRSWPKRASHNRAMRRSVRDATRTVD